MLKTILLIVLFGCATQPRVSYSNEVPVIREETKTFLVDSYDEYNTIPDREPDITSVRASVEDSPDVTIPAWYRVSIAKLLVRDFPSLNESSVVGSLDEGDLVKGFEVEGDWVRIETNSYVFLPYVEKVPSDLTFPK